MLYTIKNDLIECIISDHGAEIRGLKYQGIDYMHDGNPQYWKGIAPILWPNIGAIKDGYALFNGVKYPMRKHGFLRDSMLTLVSHEQNAISFCLEDSEESRKIYPFSFKVIISYVLTDDTLNGFVEVINKSTDVMPFNLGLHPAFKIPLYENELPTDYEFTFGKMGTYEMPNVNLNDGTIDFMHRNREFINLKTLPVVYQDYDFDALVFENINTHEITLKHHTNNHGVTVSFPDFPMLGIWTPLNKCAPFICIEPWLGCADRPNTNHIFEEKRDIVKLEPKGCFATQYKYKFF